ncbi:hypothetical protein RJ639_008998 [Escallonia herrerae]|uniref:Thylakoid membrane protein TERC, chloroplastic n=1 Tax=Escallonia herrerae TaxID=1293975 RepID=A0AA89AVI5_9ASTE|nr:hypothetical protein RJ639_008998 [Escallonia herrerae]
MRLASIIHNGLQSSRTFDLGFLKTCPISPPIHCTKGVPFQLTHLRTPPFYADGYACNHRKSNSLIIACSRGTQQEEGSSTSEEETSISQSRDNENNAASSHYSTVDSEEITQGPGSFTSSVKTVALCVGTAVAFGVGLGLKGGVDKASEFFAGYGHESLFWRLQTCSFQALGPHHGFQSLISSKLLWYLLEQSLSVDNLFVFVLIFKYFSVPTKYQNRVLSYGIVGAIIFRLSIILLGTATLQRFETVNLLLAAILLYSSFKLFVAEDEETDLSNNFLVKTCQKFIPVTCNILFTLYFPVVALEFRVSYVEITQLNDSQSWKVLTLYHSPDVTASYDGDRFFTLQDDVWKATPLLLTVAVIELSDIAFAVDSIPAVFGVTQDPFIVFTSNLFAILGLRSLYTLISESMSELEYLQVNLVLLFLPSIGAVLGFIGCKMIADFFGYHVSTEASLGFVATTLGTGVLLSLTKKSD